MDEGKEGEEEGRKRECQGEEERVNEGRWKRKAKRVRESERE